MKINLSPHPKSVLTQQDHYKDGAFSVAMKSAKGNYGLFLFDGFIKRFTKSTMPKEIKAKLTMINAIPYNLQEEGSFLEAEMYIWRSFVSEQYKAFADIGWKVSPSMTVIVLSLKEIDNIQGV